jgi:hypothetical protein
VNVELEAVVLAVADMDRAHDFYGAPECPWMPISPATRSHATDE